MMEEPDIKRVEEMIRVAIAKSNDYTTRKRGDTPTDLYQLVPQMYADLNGTRALRPKNVNTGQHYWSTQDHYPWWTDGVSSWFSSTGSIVAAI